MKINIAPGLDINLKEILAIQDKYKDELKKLNNVLIADNKYDLKPDLYQIILSETKKYRSSLAIDLKITKRKKQDLYIKQMNDDIFNYIKSKILNNTFDLKGFIFGLHKIIYPKGHWGETISPSGQTYYKSYESGKYRETEELISIGGTSYYFIPPKEIEKSIKNIDGFLSNQEVVPIIKYIIFIFYFWNIHPFNDGNGAIARFLFPYLLVQTGYKIASFDYENFFINPSNGLFYDKNNINYNNIISNIVKNYS